MSGATCVFSGFCTILVLIQFIKIFVPWLYRSLIGPKLFGPKVDLRKMGEWALVTGATEGIGKAYAKALAEKGLNVVLVSRSAEKLANVSKEIQDAHNVQIKTIAVDFTHGTEIYKTIKEGIEGLEIGVLVNNVGISYKCPEYFLLVPDGEQFMQDIIACNIYSVTFMCKLILPGMIERKRGVIVNVSSMSANIPSPLLSVYGATKAFVDKFSGDLGIEYKKDGIIVQSVMPGFVATNMSKIKKSTLMAPSPDIYVHSALKTIGIDSHTYGYFPHFVMKLMIDAAEFVLPTSKVQDICLQQLLNIRNRAQKRENQNENILTAT